jgi:integrase
LSIQKRHSGSYVVRWNEGKRKRGKTFDRLRDAQKFEAEIRRRKAMGGIVALPEQITLEQLYDRYLLAKVGREKNTRDGYAAMWRHLSSRLGHVPVAQISPGTVEALGPEMIKDGVGVTSANKAIGMLSSMMNRAVVWGYVDRNPCMHVERPRSNGKRKVEALSPRQVESIRSKMTAKPDGSIASKASHARDRAFVSVLAYAGLRPGEAQALTWEDIGTTIHVDKAVAHGKVKSTKNRKERNVTLLPSLARDLNEWKLASGRPESGLVFPNGRGEPWSDAKYRNWRVRRFEPAALAAGFPDATPYTLRHSFASLLLASGAGSPEVAYEMGHTVGVLTSTYSHMIAEFRGGGQIDPESQIQAARLVKVA